MKKTDNLYIKGFPILKLYDKTMNLIYSYEDRNLVVTTGKSQLTKAIHGSLPLGDAEIIECAVGDGGVDPEHPFDPISPLNSDDALYNEKYRSIIDNKELEEGYNPVEVTFETLFSSEDVNSLVSEAGLFYDDGTMFARFTFPTMYLKDDKGYHLEVIWKIIF